MTPLDGKNDDSSLKNAQPGFNCTNGIIDAIFPELWGQKGISGGRYMTLLSLISHEQNGNLNVASDVNCIRINYKPLVEITLKITPF